MKEMDLSIIIVALNEEEHLKVLLRQLNDQIKSVDQLVEIILADGGSTDQSVEVAKNYDIKIIKTRPNRGAQMNQAAKEARGNYLFFLHADSEILDNLFIRKLFESIKKYKDQERWAAHCALSFKQQSNQKRFKYFYYESKTILSRPLVINGDQGLLIPKKYFEELQGFNSQYGFLEDQLLSREIFKSGKWHEIPVKIVTSSRRFEREGFKERMSLNSLIVFALESGFDEFFSDAKKIYKEQAQTRKIILWPFYESLLNMIERLDDEKLTFVKKRAGHFIAKELWQVFFFFDVLLNWMVFKKEIFEMPKYFLNFYDKFVSRFVENRIWSRDLGFTLLLVYGKFMKFWEQAKS